MTILFFSLTTDFFLKEIVQMIFLFTFAVPNAGVVKLVDTLDLGSSASRHGGSSPSTRTIIR